LVLTWRRLRRRTEGPLVSLRPEQGPGQGLRLLRRHAVWQSARRGRESPAG